MTYANLFKVWATVLVAILAAILLSVAALTTGARAQEASCSGKVVLDAGHGGTDSGAVSANGLREKDQTLEVATSLKRLLEGDGCTVYMTRTRDVTLSNNDRYTYANTTGADVLVSIHMNGSTVGTVDYTTTLFGKWRKDKELAYAVFGDNVNSPKINPPTYGLRTLSAVNGGGTTGGAISTKTPYSFASGVLLKSNMPATIAETVFITNATEANQLADPTTYGRQQQIAEALETGIEHYLSTH
jgi:N-acetylmuramoyl-L-alanine amidase